jgi:hypothetical protein
MVDGACDRLRAVHEKSKGVLNRSRLKNENVFKNSLLNVVDDALGQSAKWRFDSFERSFQFRRSDNFGDIAEVLDQAV